MAGFLAILSSLTPALVHLCSLLSLLYHYHLQTRIYSRVPTGLPSSRELTRRAGCPLLCILPPDSSLEKAMFSWVLLFVSLDFLLLLQFFEAYHL